MEAGKLKRRKRWIVLAAASMFVVLLTAFLLFRAPFPFKFLNGTAYQETHVTSNPLFPDSASIVYLGDLAPDKIGKTATEELATLGWTCQAQGNGDFSFFPTTGLENLVTVTSGKTFLQQPDWQGKTVIIVLRPPTLGDRARSWLYMQKARFKAQAD